MEIEIGSLKFSIETTKRFRWNEILVELQMISSNFEQAFVELISFTAKGVPSIFFIEFIGFNFLGKINFEKEALEAYEFHSKVL